MPSEFGGGYMRCPKCNGFLPARSKECFHCKEVFVPSEVSELLERLDKFPITARHDAMRLWPETRAVIEAAEHFCEPLDSPMDGFKREGVLRSALAAWVAKAKEVTGGN